MKTILLSLTHLENMGALLDVVTVITRQQDSHVIGYYPIPGPIIYAFAASSMEFPVSDALTKLYKEKLPDVKAKFLDHMRRQDISYEWRDDKRFEPHFFDGIMRHGRETDLIILGHESPGEKGSGDEVKSIYDVVVGSGRPVLVVPLTSDKPFQLNKVSVAWNASRESCRAAFDSVPLLAKAKEVSLVWVNPEKTLPKVEKLPGAELAAAVARHGANITTKALSNRKKIQLALVDHVKEDDVDLLVMGAYGHSRLREQILGGVTEHILSTLPCPVLMSN